MPAVNPYRFDIGQYLNPVKDFFSPVTDWLSKPLLPEYEPPPAPSLGKFWTPGGGWMGQGPYDRPDSVGPIGQQPVPEGLHNVARALSAPKDIAREAAAIAVPPLRIPVAASYAAEFAKEKDPIGVGLSALPMFGLLKKGKKAADVAKKAANVKKVIKAPSSIPLVNEPDTSKLLNSKYWKGLQLDTSNPNKILEVGKITIKDGQIRKNLISGKSLWKGLQKKEYAPENLSDELLERSFKYYNKIIAPKTTNLKIKAEDPTKKISILRSGLEFEPKAFSEAVPRFGKKPFQTAFADFANADRVAQRAGNESLKKEIKKGFNKYLRRQGYMDEGGKYSRDDVKKVMSNYYDHGRDWSLLKNIAAPIAQTSKSMILSAGVPKTGANWFGYSMALRAALDPKGNVLRTTRMLFNPKEGARSLEKHSKDIPRLVRAGLDLSAADQMDFQLAKAADKTLAGVKLTAKTAPGKLLKGTLGKLDEWFGEPLFGRIIPALKIESSLAHEAANRAKGLGPRKAVKEAVQTANGFYSGNNWKALVKVGKKGEFSSRSPELNDFFRATMLAPQWLQSSARIGKGALTLKTPEGRAYRAAVGRITALYAAASATQKATTGKWIHENEQGKRFEMAIGKSESGKIRYLPLGFGTGADFVRLPLELAQAVHSGDDPMSSALSLLRNRMSAPLSASINLLANTNYRGDPLAGKDRYGKEIPFLEGLGNQGMELLNISTPQQVGAAVDFGRGKSNFEEALVDAFEIPLRYRRSWNPGRSKGRRRRRGKSRKKR